LQCVAVLEARVEANGETWGAGVETQKNKNKSCTTI